MVRHRALEYPVQEYRHTCHGHSFKTKLINIEEACTALVHWVSLILLRYTEPKQLN